MFFGVCGIGLGHAGRCVPIARKLVEMGAEVLFSTYRDAIKYVKKEGFPLVKAPSVGFMVKPDGSVDFQQTIANPGPILASFTLTKQIEAEIKFIRAFKPDVVVSDSRISTIIAAKMNNIPDISILNQFQIIIPRRSRLLTLAKLVDAGALAMIGKIWTSGTAQLMIPDFPPPYILSAGNLNIPKSYQKRVKLIGPILPLHPKDLPSKQEIRRKLGLDENTPLIFIPISGPIKERIYIEKILKNLVNKMPKKYQIVMSLGDPVTSTKPSINGNVTIFKWIPNRFEYLKACDIVISRAGHGTLTQGISFGKPMILIPTPNHTEQLNNATRLVKMGIAKVLEQNCLNKESFAKGIEELIYNESFKKRMEDVHNEISHLNGLTTAVETIIKISEK